jgi:hypothetical protein
MKTFKDLKEGDQIYFLSTINGLEVCEREVISISVLENFNKTLLWYNEEDPKLQPKLWEKCDNRRYIAFNPVEYETSSFDYNNKIYFADINTLKKEIQEKREKEIENHNSRLTIYDKILSR